MKQFAFYLGCAIGLALNVMFGLWLGHHSVGLARAYWCLLVISTPFWLYATFFPVRFVGWQISAMTWWLRRTGGA